MFTSLKTKVIALGIISFFLILPETGFSAVKISFYLGKVKIHRKGRIINARRGTTLKSGDIIKTGGGAIAELRYSDGSKIKIHEKSSARIGSTRIKKSDDISLISGNLTGKFSKLKRGRHKVYTPTIVCSVRGTEFQVSVAKNGESRVDLNEGKLDTSNPWGRRNMNAGDKTQSRIAGEPGDTSGSANDWARNSNKSFQKNPWGSSNRYKKYMRKMRERNDSTKKKMEGWDTSKRKSKKQIKKDAWHMKKSDEKTKDDILMNECANDNISNIINGFRKNKRNIYKEFYRIKKESNKVLQVQMEAYKNIQKIKDDYKKHYKEIVGGALDEMKRIKGGTINMNDFFKK